MVQGYRRAKRAHHNRTNLYNMETKTEPVFATFRVETSKRMECPEHCSGQSLVVVAIIYINVALYQLYMAEHAKVHFSFFHISIIKVSLETFFLRSKYP
jgi:hypothetical protein